LNKCILNHLDIMFRYGNHHTRNVRNIRMPSHIIPNNIHPYDSSSSSKTINDAEKNTAILKSAAQPSSPHLLKSNLQLKNFYYTYFF